MKQLTFALLTLSHLSIGGIGFAVGIYLLPILIAPDAPSKQEIQEKMEDSLFIGQFDRERLGSDRFHWGEGDVYLSRNIIALDGKLAPGPDYKIYLSPHYIETEQAFWEHRQHLRYVSDVKTFDNFMVNVPRGIDISQFNTVVVWCETFGEYITSAQFKD